MAGNNLLSLDVGKIRVGVAMSRPEVRIPVALKTLARTAEDFWLQLDHVIEQNNVGTIIVGLPRGLQGQNTAQTAEVQTFGAELAQRTGLPIAWQDEALTSVHAEAALKQTNKNYTKADIDALAACYILNDYLENNKVLSA
jgi:putative holliday junction resolvase